MKTVLCYGDSNTYGYNPENGNRYPKEIRWVNILASLLGNDYEVISEGLNGRTTAFDRDNEDTKNGLKHFKAIYNSHRPVDYLIFMLGTNDCSSDVDVSAKEICLGMEKLVLKAKDVALEKQGYLPKIIIVVPAKIRADYKGTKFEYQLNDDSIYKANELIHYYKELAIKHNCLYLDASNLEVSKIDCEHLTVEAHEDLAKLLKNIIINN